MTKEWTIFTFAQAFKCIKHFRLLRARDTYSVDGDYPTHYFVPRYERNLKAGWKRDFVNEQRADEWFCEWYYPDGMLWFAEFFKGGELIARIAIPQPPEHPLPPLFPLTFEELVKRNERGFSK